jgi:hypothetical protein
MNLYKVDYDIKDVDAYKADPPTIPRVVLAENFDEAVKVSKKYETDNLSVRELILSEADYKVAIVKGYKGV